MLYFFKQRAKILHFSDIYKSFHKKNCFVAKMRCLEVEYLTYFEEKSIFTPYIFAYMREKQYLCIRICKKRDNI